MSLILDALKKSEAERQRGQVPHVLSSLPTAAKPAQASKHSILPWLIIVALLAAALLYFFLNKAEPPLARSETRLEPEASVKQKIGDQTKAVIIPVPVAVMPETPKALPEPSAVESVEKPAKTIAENAASSTLAAPTGVATAAEAAIPSSPAEAYVTSISAMPTEVRQQLPALKLSMHVFSADASKRFAIIDGQRVNEGSSLGSAVVEHIRQDGVVLSVHGQMYLLPRP
jgi:general secretion pathway protein B